MNPKYALGFLIAVLAVVSQLIGEDSAISSVVSSDDAALANAMNDRDAAKAQVAGENRRITNAKIDPTKSDVTSLSEFYGETEEPDEIPTEGLVTDADPDADDGPAQIAESTYVAPVSSSAVVPTSSPPTNRPFEPFARNADGSLPDNE